MKKIANCLAVLLTCVLVLNGCGAEKVEASLEVNPTRVSLGADAGSERSLQVLCNVSWTASSTDSWITVSPSAGNGDGDVVVSVDANSGPTGQLAPSREGTLTFNAGDKSETIRIIQSGESVFLAVAGGSVEVGSGGGTVEVEVEHNTTYSYTTTVDWISLPTKGTTTDKLGFVVAKNENLDPRQGQITFTSSSVPQQVVTVSQAGSSPSFEGSGTPSDPFLISSAEDLQDLSTYTGAGILLSASFRQTSDIDMKGASLSPVAQDSGKPFAGMYDGAGHKISNLVVETASEKASGLFAYLDGATVRNVVLDKYSIDAEYVYCGGVAGYAKKSTIENCKVVGNVRQYVSGLTVQSSSIIPATTANAGYSGGVVGLSEESTIKDCELEGTATFYGKFSGGIAGYAFNSTIDGCRIGNSTTVNVYYHFGGGIVGRVRGKQNVVRNCVFEGNYTTVGYCAGGIAGQVLGGRIEGCTLGSYAVFGSDKYHVGGIAGSCQPQSAIVVDNCAVYGTVKGAYSVGGIVGYAGQGSGASSDKDLILGASGNVTITNCAMVGGHITATQGNSSGYSIAAGIIGWNHTGSKLVLRGCYSMPGLIETTYGDNKNGVICGISSYQNSSLGATIENCYSAFGVNDLLVCGDQASTDPQRWYAGIHIRCTQATTVRNCYSTSDMRVGFSSGSATESGCAQYTVAEMTNGTMLAQLQANADGTVWVAGANGYPTIQGLPQDLNPKPAAKKKVSVIGDSISTFKGWVPGGYSCHYPATDGTLTLVNETYWYRLIHDYMSAADLEMNIAYSGSTVTNTTEENYTARYGTASNSWWHNSFTERFAACGGMGRPDIILIHGGTNDWAHNADPLAPGVAIRNDATNIYGGSAPSADVMNSIYAVADAAKTRSEVNALPDGTFCEAYVKLLCQIRERYPECKVVCIIGDYLSQSIEQSVLQIAEHYGAKTVNLFRVNGFNDLGGYSPETLTGLGKPQPNMPKHDHTDLNSAGGCHPGSQCMKFMAEKIYNELGSWLEQ